MGNFSKSSPSDDGIRHVKVIQWTVGISCILGAIAVELLFPGLGAITALTTVVFGCVAFLSPVAWRKRPLFWAVSLLLFVAHVAFVLTNRERLSGIGVFLILFGVVEILGIAILLGIILDKLKPVRT